MAQPKMKTNHGAKRRDKPIALHSCIAIRRSCCRYACLCVCSQKRQGTSRIGTCKTVHSLLYTATEKSVQAYYSPSGHGAVVARQTNPKKHTFIFLSPFQTSTRAGLSATASKWRGSRDMLAQHSTHIFVCIAYRCARCCVLGRRFAEFHL